MDWPGPRPGPAGLGPLDRLDPGSRLVRELLLACFSSRHRGPRIVQLAVSTILRSSKTPCAAIWCFSRISTHTSMIRGHNPGGGTRQGSCGLSVTSATCNSGSGPPSRHEAPRRSDLSNPPPDGPRADGSFPAGVSCFASLGGSVKHSFREGLSRAERTRRFGRCFTVATQ